MKNNSISKHTNTQLLFIKWSLYCNCTCNLKSKPSLIFYVHWTWYWKIIVFAFLFSAFEIWFKQTLEDLGDVITTFQIPVGIPQFKRELNLFIDTNFINCTPCTRKPCSRQYFRHKIRTEYQTFKPCQKLYYIPCTILRIKMRWNRNKTIVIILYFMKQQIVICF